MGCAGPFRSKPDPPFNTPVQPFESVMVAKYIPAFRLLMVAPVAVKGDGPDQATVYAPVLPPLGVRVIEPSITSATYFFKSRCTCTNGRRADLQSRLWKSHSAVGICDGYAVIIGGLKVGQRRAVHRRKARGAAPGIVQGTCTARCRNGDFAIIAAIAG